MRRMLCVLVCLLMVSVLPASGESSEAITVFDRMMEALSSQGTAYFRIQSDFTFSSVSGKQSISDSEGTVTSDLTAGEAQNMLINHYAFISLRIENGAVSTDDAYLQCEANVLPDNSGVSIRIFSDDGDELKGVITGNELAGDASYGLSSSVYGVGRAMAAYGSFKVGMKAEQSSEIPPKPVYIESIVENEDGSISITWKDPNSIENVRAYLIYRKDIFSDNYNKIETVSDCYSWTDTSSTAKEEDSALEYIIVVEGVNGQYSKQSNSVYIILTDRI